MQIAPSILSLHRHVLSTYNITRPHEQEPRNVNKNTIRIRGFCMTRSNFRQRGTRDRAAPRATRRREGGGGHGVQGGGGGGVRTQSASKITSEALLSCYYRRGAARDDVPARRRDAQRENVRGVAGIGGRVMQPAQRARPGLRPPLRGPVARRE